MTSPIKPPGGGPGKGPDEAAGAGKTPSGASPVESFREAASRGEDASAASAEALSGYEALEGDLRAGRIDAKKAIDILVARALESAAAEALPPAQRAELEAHLRRTLAEDPSLVALTKDLER